MRPTTDVASRPDRPDAATVFGKAKARNHRLPEGQTIQRRPDGDGGGTEDLPNRLMAAREKVVRERQQREAQEAGIGKQKAAVPAIQQQYMSAAEFLASLREAVGKADPNEVFAVLERAPQDAECVDALKAIMDDTSAGAGMQRYAAEALVRIGTGESVQFVLDQLLAAYNVGDTDRANSLLAALEAPTTPDGVRAMFDMLLGRGVYAQTQGTLPAEVVSAIRKSLRAAPDRETVGKLAAELYLDPQVMTNSEAMRELDEVSHPVMLAQLAGRAYQENLPENAAQFLDRLGQSDDQGTVQAIVQMVPNQSVPLDDVGMALYNWSIRHPHEALPGLFLEYLTDSARPPEQRSVAAFGLAGITNQKNARVVLEKALQSERDPTVRTTLQTTLTILNQEQPR